MSSRYTRRICSSFSWKMVCINFWKRAGALHNPKGILLYSNKPMGVVNAVLCRSSGCTSTWLYADAKSVAEKYRATPRALGHQRFLDSREGEGVLPGLGVKAAVVHVQTDAPDFLRTSTMGDAKSLWLGRMTPFYSSSCRCCFTSSLATPSRWKIRVSTASPSDWLSGRRKSNPPALCHFWFSRTFQTAFLVVRTPRCLVRHSRHLFRPQR